MLLEFITLNRDAIIEATYRRATHSLRPTRGMASRNCQMLWIGLVS
jgi:hypothetical protein